MGGDTMGRRLDVLLVGDDEGILESIGDLLRLRHEARVADGLREAVGHLVNKVPDAIICDLDLPPFRGDVLLSMVAREHPEVRRVLYTGSADLEMCGCLAAVAHVVL